MSLGHRIRQLRQSRGLTQSQLGGSELSKSFISLLEKNRTQPSVDTLTLLARRLGTSVDGLLGQDGHVSEMVAHGLLTLSGDAIRAHDFDGAARLLDTVGFLVERHRLEEAGREVGLQRGQMALEQRQFDQAWAVLTAAHGMCKEAKDFWRIGRSEVLMGWVKVRQRDFPGAHVVLVRALGTLRRARAGRDPARVEALIALGTTHGYLGDYPAAIRRYREAANADAARHHSTLRGQAFWGIGVAARKMEDYDMACEYLVKARDTFEQAEDLPNLMRVLHNVGQLLVDRGRPKEALRHFYHALRVAERLHRPVDQASLMTELARAHLHLQNLEDAEHFARESLRLSEKNRDVTEVAAAKVVLADVCVQRKNQAEAIELLKEAFTVYRERKMRAKLAETARRLGLLLRARGAHAQAADYLALSIEHGSKAETGRPKDLVEIPD